MKSSEPVVKIKSVYKPSGLGAELVVKVKNDYINDCSNFVTDVYVDKANPTMATVVASKEGVVYSGKPETQKSAVCQNYVIVVNKRNKRARLLPIAVCDLAQVSDKDKSYQLPDLVDNISKAALLTDKFGSKKSKRRSEMRNKMKVDPNACEEQLASVVEETQIDESYLGDLDDGTGSIKRLIPTCNRSASTPQFVYNLDDILSENERSSLLEAATFYIDNPPVEFDTVSSHFLSSHYKLIEKSVNVEKMMLLLYTDCLLRLLKIFPKELKQHDSWNKISPHSKMIIYKLKKEFTDSRMVTTLMRHKISCHALVAILLSCDYKVYLDLISSCFSGIDNRKLLQLLRLVGLVPASKTSSTVFALKVPLPSLPVASSPKKKRR